MLVATAASLSRVLRPGLRTGPEQILHQRRRHGLAGASYAGRSGQFRGAWLPDGFLQICEKYGRVTTNVCNIVGVGLSKILEVFRKYLEVARAVVACEEVAELGRRDARW